MRETACLGLVAIAACLLTTACGSKNAELARKGNVYAVTADKTPFFRYGPQQGSGPDQELTRDTLVTLIRPSFGYSKVQLEAGAEGYVASEDIRPAPSTLLAALNTPPSNAASDEEQYAIDPDDPRLTAPETELPSPDLPPLEDEAGDATDESGEIAPAEPLLLE